MSDQNERPHVAGEAFDPPIELPPGDTYVVTGCGGGIADLVREGQDAPEDPFPISGHILQVKAIPTGEDYPEPRTLYFFFTEPEHLENLVRKGQELLDLGLNPEESE